MIRFAPPWRWLPRRELGLRVHLVALTLVVLVPLAAGASAAIMAATTAYRRGFEQSMEARAQLMAQMVDAEFERLAPVLRTLASAPFIRADSTEAEYREWHRRSVRLSEEFGTTIGVSGPAPALAMRFISMVPFGSPLPPLPPHFRATAARAVATGGIAVSNLEMAGNLGPPRVLMMLPVQRDGQTIAGIGASVWVQALSAKLAAAAPTDRLVVSLFDASGTLVARSRDAEAYLGRPAPPSLRGNSGLGQGLRTGTGLSGQPALVAFHRLQAAPGWTIAVVVGQDVYRNSWLVPLAWMLAGAGGALVAAILGAFWLTRRLVNALREVSDLAQRAAARALPFEAVGCGTGRLPRVTEFEALRHSVTGAAQALRQEATQARNGSALLRSVLDCSADVVFVKDRSGRYLVANEAAAAAFGRPLAEVIGRTDAELWPESSAIFTTSDEAVMREGVAISFEVVHFDPDTGQQRIHLSTKAPWHAAGSDVVLGVVGVAHDITERIAVKERLRETERKLNHLARVATMDALATGIAHELGQPLGAAANYLGGAVRLLGPAADIGDIALARSGVERAAERVLHAGQILRRMRDFLSSNNRPHQFEPIAEVVREALDIVVGGYPEGGPTMVTFLAAPDSGDGMMDRVQVQQVVVNIVRNAIEAMRGLPAGHARELVVQVGTPDPATVSVSVTDTGPGLAPHIQQRLFEPFQTTKQGGMGVGLSICRSIVENHGGLITAGAAAGGGTTFTFTLARDGGLPAHAQAAHAGIGAC